MVRRQPFSLDAGQQASAEQGDGLLEGAIAIGPERGPSRAGQGAQEVLHVDGQEGIKAQFLARGVNGFGGQALLLQSLADGEEGDGQVLQRGGGGDVRPEQGHQFPPGDGGGSLQGQVSQQPLVQTRGKAADPLTAALQGEGAEEPQTPGRTERREGRAMGRGCGREGLWPGDARGAEAGENAMTSVIEGNPLNVN
ncbi:MAG: hypothetical protein IPJ58_09685 [Ardenticatenia bacterium]|nr:hypothetical protein [Ardenticatenia bacterium]